MNKIVKHRFGHKHTSPEFTVSFDGRRYAAKSFSDAAQRVSAMRDRVGIGASEFYGDRDDNGLIRLGEEAVARVSYNGRIWCTKCEGEIDPDPSHQSSSVGDCKCGNTSHVNRLSGKR